MQSDFTLSPAQFSASNVTEGTSQVCDALRQFDEATAHEFGDVVKMRAQGGPNILPQGEYISVESREPGRLIPCRMVKPSNREPSGVLIHFHGGGVAIGSHDANDALLQRFADASDCTTISVGYRLAPENPFPSSQHDCFDAADYIVKNGPEKFGGPLRFIGGESAGAYLTMQTFYHLVGIHADFDTLKGLILSYGCFSWSSLPTVFTKQNTVCIDAEKISIFRSFSFPDDGSKILPLLDEFEDEFGVLAERGHPYDHYVKHPAISALYRRLDLIQSRLPPALFLCGTADPLLDDTILMAAHWQMAGGHGVVKFVTGAPHAFVELPIETGDCCIVAADYIRQFLNENSG